MIILMLSTGLGLGGAETQVCALARKMLKQGHEVHLAWLTGTAGVIVPEGATIHPFGISKTPWGVIRATLKLRELIRQVRPDVVHAHMVHANIIARLTRLLAPMPKLICTAHSSREGGKATNLAYRLTDRLTDITTQVSEQARAAFIENKACPPERIITVHNGIDTNEFAPDMKARQQVRQSLNLENRFVFLTVGRLEAPKNYKGLIRAFALLINELENETQKTRTDRPILLIAGDGSMREDLESLVNQLNMGSHIQFLGERTDVPALMNAAEIFVLSSDFEGFGLVVAEAMATELPVVATACGIVPEILDDIGYVVPVNDPPSLAQAMHSTLELNTDTRAAIGRRSRQRVIDCYGLEQIVETWLGLYQGNRSAPHEKT